MKLNEIKAVQYYEVNLSEGVIPVHITLTLEQILRDGKITNNVQYFIMGALVEMFKNGGPTRWPRDLNAYSMTTNAALIEGIKGLSEQEHVGIATWLMTELQRPVDFETNPYCARSCPQDPVEYVRWVLSRQD